jgi:hypothetical protein
MNKNPVYICVQHPPNQTQGNGEKDKIIARANKKLKSNRITFPLLPKRIVWSSLNVSSAFLLDNLNATVENIFRDHFHHPLLCMDMFNTPTIKWEIYERDIPLFFNHPHRHGNNHSCKKQLLQREKKRNTIVDKFWKKITRLNQEGGGCMGKVKDDKRMY